MTKDKPRVYIEAAQSLTAEGIKKVCNLEKPLSEKEVQSGIRGGDRVVYIKDAKEAIEGAEKDLKEGITCQCGNAYRCPNHNLIIKIWEKWFGDIK